MFCSLTADAIGDLLVSTAQSGMLPDIPRGTANLLLSLPPEVPPAVLE
jgi:hypothetical protein